MAGGPAPDVTAIIIAFDVREEVLGCLRNLEELAGELTLETIVVDNGSSDGTADAVARDFPGVEVVRLATNEGLPARNYGLRRATGRYRMFIDSDARLTAGALATMVARLEQMPRVGLVGPRLVYPSGELQLSPRRFPPLMLPFLRLPGLRGIFEHRRAMRRHLLAGEPHERRLAEYVLGACQLFRAEAQADAGEIDEAIWFGHDDADWCFAMRRAGWQILYEPDARVIHDYRRTSAAKPFSRHALRQLIAHFHFQRKWRGLREELRGEGQALDLAAARGPLAVTDGQSRTGPAPSVAVVICTRDRPQVLRRTLDTLTAQSDPDFETVIVDQSASDPVLQDRVDGEPRWRLIKDPGRGVARARNIGWKASTADWVVYLDDDVLTAPDWMAEMRRAIVRHPECSIIMGHTPATGQDDDGYLTVSAFPVEVERVLAGRWLRPWLIGFTLNQAFRRTTLVELEGFDERLGAGAPAFPSSADMDINFRFLRAGGSAALVPRVIAAHDQWRTTSDLGPQYERYMRGWSGFSMKHLRTGDVLAGVWLWHLGFIDLARMTASAGRRRSRTRLVVAAFKLRGLLEGTYKGLRHPW
ncbi:MAG: glycosyltransferase [Solirubrobacterales bacterium]|nr:glycosyltransferase [Solirubrobacterales bacterium]